jgi:hypothetical protein
VELKAELRKPSGEKPCEIEYFLASVGLMPNGVELKAERRKPSGEKNCDVEDIPSLTGVLAHFRLY